MARLTRLQQMIKVTEAKLNKEQEELYELYERHGETDAQYRSECAAFGDAWPGAVIEVDALRKAVDRQERRVASIERGLASLKAKLPQPVNG